MDIFAPIFAGLAGMMPCLMFAGVAALIVVAIVWGIMKARERREAMLRLGAELHLQYYPDDPWDLPSRYSQFDLFTSGHSRKASNVLSGEIGGRPVLFFDYQYTTGSGKNQTTHYHQVAVLETPILAPRLQMRRESFLDKIAAWVGHDDLNFESDEFSRRYHVKCTEPKFAYDVLHARLIEYLLACGNVPALEMSGPLLLLYDSGSGQVENYRRLLAIGEEIVRSIPDYVLHARGGGTRTPESS